MGHTSFGMAVCVGDVRAEDYGVEKRARRPFTFVKLELFSRVLEHVFEKRCSRATVRAIKYQYSFIPFPTVPSTFTLVTLMGSDSLSPQPCIRGNKPLDRAFKTLARVSPVQKPHGMGVSRVLNGLAPSRPTSFRQTLFERLWYNLVESNVCLRSQEHPGELHGQCGVLVLVRPGES